MTDLTGTTALVTGASSGIGLEVSVKIARMGADLVMVARDVRKGERALGDVKRRSGSDKVSLLLCDFASQASVRALAGAFRAKHSRLEVLVNNAGTIARKRRTTKDGLEYTFAVNHLGPFLLTNLLLDLLKKSAPSRVVNVASAAHRRGEIEFGNLQFEKGGYSLLKAYSRSKLANVLFTSELAQRLAATGVDTNSVHPGVVATNLWYYTPWFYWPLLAIFKLFMITPEQGADTIVYLATSSEVEGQSGGYYEKNRRVDPSPPGRDAALGKRLWDESARLVSSAARGHGDPGGDGKG